MTDSNIESAIELLTQDQVKKMSDEVLELRAENEVLREALEFVADPMTSPTDAYEKAREALAKIGEVKK